MLINTYIYSMRYYNWSSDTNEMLQKLNMKKNYEIKEKRCCQAK